MGPIGPSLAERFVRNFIGLHCCREGNSRFAARCIVIYVTVLFVLCLLYVAEYYYRITSVQPFQLDNSIQTYGSVATFLIIFQVLVMASEV